MKTTVEISDALLEEAKKVMRAQKVTLRALIEQGLRRRLDEERKPVEFRLRDAAFAGKGLGEGVQEGSWEAIRRRIYQGRGE